MSKVGGLRVAVFCFAFLLFAIGCAIAGYAIYNSYELADKLGEKQDSSLYLTHANTPNFVVGGLYILIGIFGLFAGCCKSRVFAALYLFFLVLIMLAVVAVEVVYILRGENFINPANICTEGTAPDCNELVEKIKGHMKVFVGAVLGSTFVFCGLSAIVAGAYWRALVHEHSHGYHPVY